MRRMKEELFLAVMLLPSNCWYTRAVKWLGVENEEGSEMGVRRVPITEEGVVIDRILGESCCLI